MVYIRRMYKRAELASDRLPVVYHDHRDSRGAAVLQICKPELFPFGKEVVYGGGAGSFLLNIIWLVVSGLPLAIESVVIGALLCMTIVGIPFGLQQFKLAKLALMPFGSEIR